MSSKWPSALAILGLFGSKPCLFEEGLPIRFATESRLSCLIRNRLVHPINMCDIELDSIMIFNSS